MKHLWKVTALTLALAMLPVLALAGDTFGSAAVDEGAAYTLEDMLTYAMQDEYLAEAEYAAIQTAFGVNNPYANIMQAEATHQQELLPLFNAYGIAVPENTASGLVSVPATLQETYEIGVQAEINNIAMYEAFLAQSGLSSDVRAVFTDLMNASQSHLQAFSRNAEKTGTGLGVGAEQGRNSKQTADETAGYGNGQGSGNQAADTQTRGNGGGSANTCDTCEPAETVQTQQARGGRNRK